MADRKTKAEMDLDASGVVREVPIITDAIGKIDRSVDGLDRDLGKLDRQVEEVGRDMAKTAVEGGLLNRELEKARDRMRELNIEFDKTGDPKLLKDIRKARSELVQLERMSRDFQKAAEAVVEGIIPDTGGRQRSFFGRLLGGGIPNEAIKSVEGSLFQLGDVFKGTLRQQIFAFARGLGPVLVPVALTIADEFLAALASGLTTGLGALGIGAGIAGALHDPAVKAAVTSLGDDIKHVFFQNTSSFIDPLKGAVRELDIFLVGKGPEFSQVFEPLAAVLGNIERGIEGFINAALPGLVDGTRRAAPLIASLAAQLPKIGKAFGDFVEKISSSEAGNRAALTMIVDLIDMILEGLGNLLQAASHVFAGMVRVIHPVADILDDIAQGFAAIPVIGNAYKPMVDIIHSARLEVDDVNKSLDDTPQAIDESAAAADRGADSFNSLALRMADTATQVKALNDGFDTMFGKIMDIDQANLKYNEELSKLKDNLKDNGTSLDITSDKGQANLKVIEQMVGSIKDLRDANVANGTEVGKANAQYEAQLKNLEDNLVALGFDRKAVEALIEKYRQIPANVNTIVNILGLDATTTRLDSVIQKFNDLDGRIVTTYITTDTTTGVQTTHRRQQGYRAAGGPVYAAHDYVVGENGPELFRPEVNGYIVPNSAYMGARMGGGGMSALQQISITLFGGDSATRALIRSLKAEIRGSFGGDVQLALGA